MPINQPLYGEFKMSVNQQTLVTGYEYNGESRTFGAGATTTLENLINVLARQIQHSAIQANILLLLLTVSLNLKTVPAAKLNRCKSS